MALIDLLRFAWSYVRTLRALHWSPATLARQQARGLRAFARKAAASPLVAGLLKGRRLREKSDLGHLPVLDKAYYLDGFAQWNVFGITEAEATAFGHEGELRRDFLKTRRGVSVGLSSGTTGRRGIFLTTAKERAQWAGAVLGRFLPGFWRQPQRIALLLRANSPLYETLGSGRVKFRYFDLYDSLPELVRRLAEFSPTVLFGPPSVLVALAENQRAGRILLKPQLVVSGAEVLDEAVAQSLRVTFGCPVRQIYQATEGFLAFTCREGWLHWNEDLLVVEREVLSREGRYFPILTDLARTTQPILRYKLNDVVVDEPGPCPCGCAFARIRSVEGREDDVLFLEAPEGGWLPVFPDFLRRVAAESAPPLADYRFEQTDANRWVMYCDAELRPAVTAFCEARGGVLPQLDQRPWVPLPAGTKQRRVIRVCPLPEKFWLNSKENA